MMLSPQAARMGSVCTTLRKIGMTTNRRFSSSSVVKVLGSGSLKTTSTLGGEGKMSRKMVGIRGFSTATTKSRAKSSLATLEDSEDEEELIIDTSKGHKLAATVEAAERTHQEAWMINLGRESDAWLHGPRPDAWFTGVNPANDCPGVQDGVIRSMPLPNLSAVTRQAAKEYFDNSWTLYETLFAGLKGEEGFYRPPPHGLRHPQIFYYGHTACLYVNKLRVAGVLNAPVNAYFESIFEVGVDEMTWDDMHKNDMLWPTVGEVHEYRKQVYETVVKAIEEHPSLKSENGVTVDQSHPMWALFMGFEHERIHLETSSVLFRETPLHLVQAPQNWPPLHPSAYQGTKTARPIAGEDYPVNRMIEVSDSATKTVDLGKPADFPSFGWDNEYGERNVEVPTPFEASQHMITNGEFYEFVSSGGYRSPEYWCEQGWSWRTHRNLKWPFFWQPAGPAGSHEYHLRTVFEVVPMPWDWPVDVTYYEAKAYCRWKSKQERKAKEYRLLTEVEHHVLRDDNHNLEAARADVNADLVMNTSGHDFPAKAGGANLNMSYGSQSPVDSFAPSSTGHFDVTGSAWEWTEDHFNPLTGFEVHPVYDDFSTPCFDGKHSMIVGGSFMSTGDEASVFARFHFRPHFLQHSGFRLVSSEHPPPATHLTEKTTPHSSVSPSTVVDQDQENVYETQQSLHMYLGLHYPTTTDYPAVMPHAHAPHHATRFPQRIAGLLTDLVKEHGTSEPDNKRVLDMGCAVGGASLELAQHFEHVDAFDFSDSFVQAAKHMQTHGSMPFSIPVEAELEEQVTAQAPPATGNKVNFFTGDACQLEQMTQQGKLHAGGYDGIMLSNLLCRLPNPQSCLQGLAQITKPGGIVVLLTPYSWLTEFTPRSKWLGGFADPVTGEAIRSEDVVRAELESLGFTQVHQEELPLLIREHARKYQYIVSQATGWRKTAK